MKTLHNCVECGDTIRNDTMVPEGEGPMHVQCWREWITQEVQK